MSNLLTYGILQQGALLNQIQPSLKAKLLFYGFYSDIIDGKMFNKLGSDWLTVAGNAGSETYQCPNTDPYIAADTDHIWFKTDESQRSTTTSELVSYDLQRTPVKYDDATPYQIRMIAIIKAGEIFTASERDSLFKWFELPILWDNSLNQFGHVKGNRVGQNLWIEEIVYPSILTDTTKIFGFYDVFDESHRTVDESDRLSELADINDTGHDLLQADTAKMPVLEVDGLLFDGLNDFIKTIETPLAQPIFVFMLVKQISWTEQVYIYDGFAGTSTAILQRVASPNVRLYSGAILNANGPQIGSWGIIRALFNSTSSKLQINDDAATIGDGGTIAGNGITIGSIGAGTSGFSNIKLGCAVVAKSLLSAQEETDIYDYLTSKIPA